MKMLKSRRVTASNSSLVASPIFFLLDDEAHARQEPLEDFLLEAAEFVAGARRGDQPVFGALGVVEGEFGRARIAASAAIEHLGGHRLDLANAFAPAIDGDADLLIGGAEDGGIDRLGLARPATGIAGL